MSPVPVTDLRGLVPAGERLLVASGRLVGDVQVL
eukprot:SAG11_NODE_11077_length_785_cov_1.097668_3_plen_33_part_01